jgi:transcriptional regulator with XRE-family HTH domain
MVSSLRSAEWRFPAEFESFPPAMATAPRPDSLAAMSARLRLIRLAYGIAQGHMREMSQSEFARLCGFNNVSTWNNAETGDNRIGIDNAMKVVRRTGVSLDYIYFGNRSALPIAMATEIDKLEKESVKPAKRA